LFGKFNDGIGKREVVELVNVRRNRRRAER